MLDDEDVMSDNAKGTIIKLNNNNNVIGTQYKYYGYYVPQTIFIPIYLIAEIL